jgi:hypothetical protein
VTFDIDKIFERERLAHLPVTEKLAMLDVLRDRLLTIRKSAIRPQASVLRESPPGYGTDKAED